MTEVKAIQTLEASLADMHAMASGSLARIRGQARCALRALESPIGARDLESIAEVLQAIAMDADMTYNDVSVEAESNGIKTVDDAWMRRLQAMHKGGMEGGAA